MIARMKLIKVVVAVAWLCGALTVMATAANNSKQLEEALKAKYQVAKTGIDRLRITQPGTVFVIRKDGVYANPSTEAGSLTTTVTDGNVVGPKGFGAAFFSKQNDRSLKAGTTVYVTRIWVRDKEVRFDIITCDTDEVNVHGSSRELRYAATVAFEFPDEFLASADADAIKKAVDVVLLPQTEVQASQTKTVALGQTEDQVKSVLGAPDKIINLGAKVIYVYKDIKVVFTEGKVVDVQ
jgi:hypothetical protein